MATKKKSIAIFISGNGSNMLAIADSVASGILKEFYEIRLVFSNNPSALGLDAAKLRGLPVKCIDSKQYNRTAFDELLLGSLSPYHLDYIVLAGYNRLLSTDIIARYRQKIINIHPADTKLYQGLHGYKWAFEGRKEKTMITVHWVDEGCDTGAIIAQQEVCLQGLTTLDAIQKAGLAVEHKLYSKVLHDLAIKGDGLCVA